MNDIALLVFFVIMACIMLVGYTLMINRPTLKSLIVLLVGTIGLLAVPLYAIIKDILTK
ncbi:MAG: hypothetical protein U0M06_05120 [Clostridia bacterium]|nr:hypothetical protein [Clostridia bacterium]